MTRSVNALRLRWLMGSESPTMVQAIVFAVVSGLSVAAIRPIIVRRAPAHVRHEQLSLGRLLRVTADHGDPHRPAAGVGHGIPAGRQALEGDLPVPGRRQGLGGTCRHGTSACHGVGTRLDWVA